MLGLSKSSSSAKSYKPITRKNYQNSLLVSSHLKNPSAETGAITILLTILPVILGIVLPNSK